VERNYPSGEHKENRGKKQMSKCKNVGEKGGPENGSKGAIVALRTAVDGARWTVSSDHCPYCRPRALNRENFTKLG
jgi:hypothetical protein